MNENPKATVNLAAFRLISDVIAQAEYGVADGNTPEVKRLADFLMSPECRLSVT